MSVLVVVVAIAAVVPLVLYGAFDFCACGLGSPGFWLGRVLSVAGAVMITVLQVFPWIEQVKRDLAARAADQDTEQRRA